MSLSSNKDKAIAKAESNAERHKKKSGKPTEGPYIDPVGDSRKYHEAGKGSKIRDTDGWYSDDVTETLEKIYGKKNWKKKKNIRLRNYRILSSGLANHSRL